MEGVRFTSDVRRGVSGRGTSSPRPSSFVPIVTDPMSSHSAFASPPWCARVRACERREQARPLVWWCPLLSPSLPLPSCLPPCLSFFPSFFPSFSFPLSSWGKKWRGTGCSLSLSLLTTNSSKVRLAYQFPFLYLVYSLEDSFSSHPPAHEGKVRQSLCATVLQEPHLKRSTSRIGFMPNCSHSAIEGGREERKLPLFPTTARALAPKTSCFLCSRF